MLMENHIERFFHSSITGSSIFHSMAEIIDAERRTRIKDRGYVPVAPVNGRYHRVRNKTARVRENDLNATVAGHTFATLIAPTCNDGIKRYAARIMTKVLATDSSPAMAATCLELPVLRIFVDDPCHTLPTRRFHLRVG